MCQTTAGVYRLRKGGPILQADFNYGVRELPEGSTSACHIQRILNSPTTGSIENICCNHGRPNLRQCMRHTPSPGDCKVNTCAGIWQQTLAAGHKSSYANREAWGSFFMDNRQNCNGEPGYQKSKGMQSLVTATIRHHVQDR